MKLGTVVTAADLNPLYSDFIPSFVKGWKAVLPEADIRIVLVASEIPDSLRDYAEHIALSTPIPQIHTAFQAQCVRLLYPRDVTRDQGVLITDIDMLPGSRNYYVDSIAALPASAFVVYRDVCGPREIAMCYNAAHPAMWESMFGTESADTLLCNWYAEIHYDGTHGGAGWSADQAKLRQVFDAWKGYKIVLNDRITDFARLDRANPWMFTNRRQLREQILQGSFSDYHCLRPYSEHADINEFYVSCLQQGTW